MCNFTVFLLNEFSKLKNYVMPQDHLSLVSLCECLKNSLEIFWSNAKFTIEARQTLAVDFSSKYSKHSLSELHGKITRKGK